MDVLGISLRDFVVAAHNLPEATPVDGLIGLDVLRRHLVCFDFLLGEITLS